MLSATPQSRLLPLALSLYLLLSSASGLQVTPGSSCASKCLDNETGDAHNASESNTLASDIVCNNIDFFTNPTGKKFQDCVTCLQNSTAVSDSENDVAWYLYNLRFSVDVCLFAYPNADLANTSISSPCALTENCQPLQSALETGNLQPGNESEFQYCAADDSKFTSSALDNCIECLQADSGHTYLSNFLIALSAGCKQQPPAGKVLGLNGTLFGTAAVTIVTPTWNETTPVPAKSVAALTTGTIVGITVAAGLLFIGGIVLLFIYWRRHKRSQGYSGNDYIWKDSRGRPIKSISSSISGGYAPFYTTDYKNPTGNPRNIEMADKIRTQHVVIPNKRREDFEGLPGSADLFGHETPHPTRQQLSSGGDSRSRSETPSSHQQFMDDGQNPNMDEMPTHPAFIPRAFTRASRCAPKMDDADIIIKSNKPDTYAIERYLQAVDESGPMMSGPEVSPPMPSATGSSRSSLPRPNALSLSGLPSVPRVNVPAAPAPGRPVSGPSITPSLILPSLSRIRSPKKYVPAPINISSPKRSSKRKSHPPEVPSASGDDIWS